jgi:hypothetical protein
MLSEWLNWRERNPCPYSQFQVTDVEERHQPPQKVRTYLVDLLQAARFEPHFLHDMAQSLGWEGVKRLVEQSVPRVSNAKRGEFGEVLTAEMLSNFHGYKIPIFKLRFKMTANQTLPTTDILALKIDAHGAIIEVCFIESKLRTSAAPMVAVDGCKQLEKDYESRLPDILTFIAARLHERNDPVYEAFKAYMRTRQDTTEQDTFRLSLCWEASAWRESALENLQEASVDLPRLTVHVIRITHLRQLTDDLFAGIGVVEVSDDD